MRKGGADDSGSSKGLAQEDVLLSQFIKVFVSGGGKYYSKTSEGEDWIELEQSPDNHAIRQHLLGEHALAVSDQHHAHYAILKFNEISFDDLAMVAHEQRLNERNSLLLSGESRNSYQLLFKPVYRNRPPAIGFLHKIIDPISIYGNAELFPRKQDNIRLPFGPEQLVCEYPVFEKEARCKLKMAIRKPPMPWQEIFKRFQALQPIELCGLKFHNENFRRRWKPGQVRELVRQGYDFLAQGITKGQSQENAQFCVLYYLWWTRNFTQQDAVSHAKQWVVSKHNNINSQKKVSKVLSEIERQAAWIWKNYQHLPVVSPKQRVKAGRLTINDIKIITEAAQGKLSLAKFLFKLVSHFSAIGCLDESTPVSKHLLASMSSNNSYVKYLKELKKRGVLCRYDNYCSKASGVAFSKNIRLIKEFGLGKALPPNITTYEQGVRCVFTMREFKELMAGFDELTPRRRNYIIKKVWG